MNKRTLGRIHADDRARRADIYRKQLDDYTRYMKMCARMCTLALRMFYNGRVKDGTTCMNEARYQTMRANESQQA